MATAKPAVSKAKGKTQVIRFWRRPADNRPTDIPRKQAMSTRFVKKVRKMTCCRTSGSRPARRTG